MSSANSTIEDLCEAVAGAGVHRSVDEMLSYLQARAVVIRTGMLAVLDELVTGNRPKDSNHRGIVGATDLHQLRDVEGQLSRLATSPLLTRCAHFTSMATSRSPRARRKSTSRPACVCQKWISVR